MNIFTHDKTRPSCLWGEPLAWSITLLLVTAGPAFAGLQYALQTPYVWLSRSDAVVEADVLAAGAGAGTDLGIEGEKYGKTYVDLAVRSTLLGALGKEALRGGRLRVAGTSDVLFVGRGAKVFELQKLDKPSPSGARWRMRLPLGPLVSEWKMLAREYAKTAEAGPAKGIPQVERMLRSPRKTLVALAVGFVEGWGLREKLEDVLRLHGNAFLRPAVENAAVSIVEGSDYAKLRSVLLGLSEESGRRLGVSVGRVLELGGESLASLVCRMSAEREYRLRAIAAEALRRLRISEVRILSGNGAGMGSIWGERAALLWMRMLARERIRRLDRTSTELLCHLLELAKSDELRMRACLLAVDLANIDSIPELKKVKGSCRDETLRAIVTERLEFLQRINAD
jgi:hypothetical protein